jgi:hypothetical protein
MGFVQINHTIDEQNPEIALEASDRSKRKERNHLWLKDKRVSVSHLFSIKAEHTPCEICQNYQVKEEQPLRIISPP